MYATRMAALYLPVLSLLCGVAFSFPPSFEDARQSLFADDDSYRQILYAKQKSDSSFVRNDEDTKSDRLLNDLHQQYQAQIGNAPAGSYDFHGYDPLPSSGDREPTPHDANAIPQINAKSDSDPSNSDFTSWKGDLYSQTDFNGRGDFGNVVGQLDDPSKAFAAYNSSTEFHHLTGNAPVYANVDDPNAALNKVQDFVTGGRDKDDSTDNITGPSINLHSVVSTTSSRYPQNVTSALYQNGSATAANIASDEPYGRSSDHLVNNQIIPGSLGAFSLNGTSEFGENVLNEKNVSGSDYVSTGERSPQTVTEAEIAQNATGDDAETSKLNSLQNFETEFSDVNDTANVAKVDAQSVFTAIEFPDEVPSTVTVTNITNEEINKSSNNVNEEKGVDSHSLYEIRTQHRSTSHQYDIKAYDPSEFSPDFGEAVNAKDMNDDLTNVADQQGAIRGYDTVDYTLDTISNTGNIEEVELPGAKPTAVQEKMVQTIAIPEESDEKMPRGNPTINYENGPFTEHPGKFEDNVQTGAPLLENEIERATRRSVYDIQNSNQDQTTDSIENINEVTGGAERENNMITEDQKSQFIDNENADTSDYDNIREPIQTQSNNFELYSNAVNTEKPSRTSILTMMMLLFVVMLLIILWSRLPSYIYNICTLIRGREVFPFSNKWRKKGYAILPTGDKSV